MKAKTISSSRNQRAWIGRTKNSRIVASAFIVANAAMSTTMMKCWPCMSTNNDWGEMPSAAWISAITMAAAAEIAAAISSNVQKPRRPSRR